MGAELGATTTVFPPDNRTRECLAQEEREEDWTELLPAEGADYDSIDENDILECTDLRDSILQCSEMRVMNQTKGGKNIKVKTSLSDRQKHIVLYGGLINLLKGKITGS